MRGVNERCGFVEPIKENTSLCIPEYQLIGFVLNGHRAICLWSRLRKRYTQGGPLSSRTFH